MTRHLAKTDPQAAKQRDAEIESLFLDGLTVAEIAAELDLTYSIVNSRVKSLGFDSSANVPTNIWALPEEERRQAFIQRAASGARDQLVKGFGSFRTMGEVAKDVVSDVEKRRG